MNDLGTAYIPTPLFSELPGEIPAEDLFELPAELPENGYELPAEPPENGYELPAEPPGEMTAGRGVFPRSAKPACLGTPTKSRNQTSSSVERQSPESLGKRRRHTLEKWDLTRVGTGILFRREGEWRVSEKTGLTHPPRECLCMRYVTPKQNGWKIVRTVNGVVWKGLIICGSVWRCLRCASLISTRKAAELTEALRNWNLRGGEALHLVLTIPHHIGDRAKDLIDRLYEARRSMRNSKAWKSLEEELKIEGYTLAPEITYGEGRNDDGSERSGYHPHTHELLWARDGLGKFSEAALWKYGDRIFELFRSACIRTGAPVPNRRGVELTGGRAVGKYITKGMWGLGDELARSAVKSGRKGRLTARDLLSLYQETNDEHWADVWLEMVNALKHKRQTYWSRGTRTLLGLGREKEDEELAKEATDKEVEILVEGDAEDLRFIIRADVQAEILVVASMPGGGRLVAEIIKKLRTSAPEEFMEIKMLLRDYSQVTRE